jgi:tetratricopeptide (TPR) repeat protein
MVRRLGAHLLARAETERSELVGALLELVKVQLASLHFHEAQQLLLQTQLLCKQHPELLARVLLQLADTQIALGDYQPAIATLATFEQVAEPRLDSLQHEAVVLNAHAHAQAGDGKTALVLLDKADESSQRETLRTLRSLQVRALTHALAAEWQSSGEAAAAAASHARALGRSEQQTAYRHYEGEALTYSGQYARAYAAFRSSLALARDIGSERWVNRNRMLLAFLEGREGAKGAKRRIGEALALAERQRETQDVAKGRLLLGLLLRLEADEAAAQREFALARQIALTIGHGLLVSECDAAMRASTSSCVPAPPS